MIKKIDIKKFGLFSDYNWDSEIGSDLTKDVFKKVNIIYGRNYSGKTTLSRIFRSVETGELHEDYKDAEFAISTDDGVINQSNLGYNNQIRVYNTDFVKKNLSWLHDNKGEILPFTLLGGDNTVIEGQLKDIDIKLGLFDPVTQKYEDSGTYKEGSLYFEENKKKQESAQINNKLRELTDSLEKKIIGKAKEIKENRFLISQKDNYDKRNLNTEIKNILSSTNPIVTLSSNEINQFQEIIKEEKKDSISQVPHVNFRLIDYISQVKELVTRKITLSQVLAELVENDLLQAWVDQGRTLHKNKKTCGFCGSFITPERREKLDEHFSKESDELKKEIQKLSEKLSAEHSKIEKYWEVNNIKIEYFYSAYHARFTDTNNKWKDAIEVIKKQLDILLEKLNERFTNPFKPLSGIDFSEIENNFIDLNLIIDELNSLIKDNEDKSTSIEQDKNNARKSLRYHTIRKFLNDIDYTSLVVEITNKNTEAETSKTSYNEVIIEINKEEKEKENLKKELRDEGRAAEKINKHLTDFFGVDGLKLEPSEQQIDDEVATRFVVKRGDKEAKNLSEGECSLVAFCYFMARIEDEIQAPDAKDKLIIYIDDPISSLDDNHIFFMYGLIESIFVPCTSNLENSLTEFPKYEFSVNQLFISTHNLGFLKYLHSLRTFTGTYKEYSSYVSHFFIEKMRKNNESNSRIKLMPLHMRRNITEYVYCFQEIYKMANEDIDYENEYTTVFNIGNNMRKFLEGFIAFKCAGHDKALHLLPYFFTNSTSSQLNRAPNEHSHLAIWLEKGTNILDLPEAKRLSLQILEGIRKSDEIHYTSLCEKIGVTPNLEL